jgi:4-hydroxy-3-methylbut-2-enyl diphosphate reductase
MKVTVDADSGFCFGVVFAIEMAESQLDAGHELYCLGDIVHNNMEVDRLKAKGLKIINHEEFAELKDCKVLIRAHGEPPETYQTAIRNNIELIDASCPVVLKLQNRVRTSMNTAIEEQGQVVIYGEVGHAEVNGLVGQTSGKAIIITGEQDIDKIDFKKPVYLFSQTTKSTQGFQRIQDLIRERIIAEKGDDISIADFNANDTICRQVSNREPQLKRFAAQYDVIIFVSGKKSSNGKVLYNVCKSVNPRTHFVSDLEEINPDWVQNVDSAGVCGATSTPMWLMDQVAEKLREIASEPRVA